MGFFLLPRTIAFRGSHVYVIGRLRSENGNVGVFSSSISENYGQLGELLAESFPSPFI